MSKALQRCFDWHVKRIVRMRKMLGRGLLDAMQVDDEGPVPEDWDKDRVRVARDLRRPKRYAPIYVELGEKMLEHHDKIEIARETEPRDIQLNIGVVNIVQPPSYPRVILTDLPAPAPQLREMPQILEGTVPPKADEKEKEDDQASED